MAKSKVKGGGTKKVCLPMAKYKAMSKEERQKLIRAKRTAAAKGFSREEDFWRGPVGCFDKSENPDKVKVVAKKAERLETWVDL